MTSAASSEDWAEGGRVLAAEVGSTVDEGAAAEALVLSAEDARVLLMAASVTATAAEAPAPAPPTLTDAAPPSV